MAETKKTFKGPGIDDPELARSEESFSAIAEIRFFSEKFLTLNRLSTRTWPFCEDFRQLATHFLSRGPWRTRCSRLGSENWAGGLQKSQKRLDWLILGMFKK